MFGGGARRRYLKRLAVQDLHDDMIQATCDELAFGDPSGHDEKRMF